MRSAMKKIPFGTTGASVSELCLGALHLGSNTADDVSIEILDAYVERDVAKALKVWENDKDVDDMYDSLFRELLTYMMEDPKKISACTEYIIIARYLERCGDHACKMAEKIIDIKMPVQK